MIDRVACDAFPFQLKTKQREAVKHLLEGKDVIVICPTGFGKSTVFQLHLMVKG